MKKEHSRYRVAKGILFFWCMFIGLGAVAGAIGMLSDPTGKAMGMDAMLPFFQVLPFADVLFRNFTFSGIALLIVNGITNLTAAGFLLAKKKIGVVLGGVFGITLMAWIVIQFVIFPANFMPTIYFIFGFAQAVTGYAALVFYKQENFSFDRDNYKNVGTDKTKLVVYFSRLGYTAKTAFETADESGAEILELTTPERTNGTAGFWWCGRFGMNRMAMPLNPIGIDLTQFDEITICSPVWVFGLAAPIRAFCAEAKGKIKAYRLVFVHYMRASLANVAKDAANAIGAEPLSVTSVCCQKGKTVFRRKL